MPSRRFQRIIYTPKWTYLLTDIILLAVSFFVILQWFPLSTNIPFQKYWEFSLVFSSVWLICSYLTHRFVKVKYMRIGVSIARLLGASALTFFSMWGYMNILAKGENYSIWVLLSIWLAMLIVSIIFLLFFHAYHYALSEENDIERISDDNTHKVLHAPRIYDEQQKENIRQSIQEQTDYPTLKYLEETVPLYSSNTYLVRSSELFNLQKIKPYRFDTIINLMPLNQIRGINKMFGIVNDRLPDYGKFVCCFEPQGTVKQKILKKTFPPLNWINYILFFLYKRVIPKLFMTSRLYYDITEGKNRVLSKAEVLGRLCYCGFEIIDEKKRGGLVYVVAQRSFHPQTIQRRLYGMFVSLPRIGKNGNLFKVYKFRTMHPYAEFLQDYIYKKYHLAAGGKFRHDIRITTLGRFMRKTWIDEWPMIINLIKGDMKPVGVRPISKQYFSLYSKELQEERIKHTPGLLPPFYADMPKTLEEIEASEMKYLTACNQKGTFATDFVYFFKIAYTIIFKRARSK